MKYKVELHDDVLHIIEQTGKRSDFYETTFTVYVEDWKHLKSLVDSAAFFAHPNSRWHHVAVTSSELVVEP